MPNRDGTGPSGQGPNTGRGAGGCSSGSGTVRTPSSGIRRGFGRGYSQGRGRGRGSAGRSGQVNRRGRGRVADR